MSVAQWNANTVHCVLQISLGTSRCMCTDGAHSHSAPPHAARVQRIANDQHSSELDVNRVLWSCQWAGPLTHRKSCQRWQAGASLPACHDARRPPYLPPTKGVFEACREACIQIVQEGAHMQLQRQQIWGSQVGICPVIDHVDVLPLTQ